MDMKSFFKVIRDNGFLIDADISKAQKNWNVERKIVFKREFENSYDSLEDCISFLTSFAENHEEMFTTFLGEIDFPNEAVSFNDGVQSANEKKMEYKSNDFSFKLVRNCYANNKRGVLTYLLELKGIF